MHTLQTSRLFAVPDVVVERLDATFTGGAFWLAWSSARNGSDRTFVTSREGAAVSLGPTELLAPGRPHVASPLLFTTPQGPMVAAIAGGAGLPYRPALWQLGPDGAQHLRTLPGVGDVFHLATADGGNGLPWLAWEEWRDDSSAVVFAQVTASGRLLPVRTLAQPERWYRSPALACSDSAVWAAWSEGPPRGTATVRAARLDRSWWEPLIVDRRPAHQEAPALALAPDGTPTVAWHAAGGGRDCLRWPVVVRVESEGPVVLSPPYEAPQFQPEADVDQGWELPSVRWDAVGRLWLAGRSSRGFQLCCHWEDGWAERLFLEQGSACNHALGVRLLPADDGTMTVVWAGGTSLRVDRLALPAPPQTLRRGPGDSPGSLQRTRSHVNGVLFGDLHQHSLLSDGQGTPEELLRDARLRYDHDFVAVTDHQLIHARELGPSGWARLCTLADAHDDPGRFTSLVGYELADKRRHCPGPVCTYFGDSRPPQLPPADSDRWHEELAEHDPLTVPLAQGWKYANPKRLDGVDTPVWLVPTGRESARGPGQWGPMLPGPFVLEALEEGIVFGFVAGSGSHGELWSGGRYLGRDPRRTGLTGLFGEAPTRALVLDALRRRETFVTTGAPIVVRVDADGAPMGSLLEGTSHVTLNVAIRPTAPIDSVWLIGRETRYPICQGSSDSEWFCRALVTTSETRTWDFVFVQVIQQDGECAWSSPIWLGASPGSPDHRPPAVAVARGGRPALQLIH